MDREGEREWRRKKGEGGFDRWGRNEGRGEGADVVPEDKKKEKRRTGKREIEMKWEKRRRGCEEDNGKGEDEPNTAGE